METYTENRKAYLNRVEHDLRDVNYYLALLKFAQEPSARDGYLLTIRNILGKVNDNLEKAAGSDD